MPDRWARDMPRRRAAGIPDDLQFATKPQLAMRQLDRLLAAGLPARWVAFEEVYGRSEKLRKKTAKAGLSYVAIIPRDYLVPMSSGTAIRADEAVADALFERRSCGRPGPKDSVMPGHGRHRLFAEYLLIRRHDLPPGLSTAVPNGRPAATRSTSPAALAGEVGHRWCRSSCAAFSWLWSLLLVRFVLRLCPAGAGVEAGRACPALT